MIDAVRLEIRESGQVARLVPISGTVEVGSDCAGVVIADPELAPVHLRLSVTADAVHVEDAGSEQGVAVNGQRLVGTARLESGDTIHIGSTSMIVRILAATTPTPPPTPQTPSLILQTPSPTASTVSISPQRPSVVHAIAAPAVDLPGPVLRIGRGHDNDIVVSDLLVSRYHTEVRWIPDGGTWEVVDLGSRNGTYVNGTAVARSPIGERDIVAVGLSLFRLRDGSFEEYRDDGAVSFSAAGLTVTAGTGRALVDDVSFSLGERALFGVIGPSGSGKSTLLYALSGRRPAASGTVLYNGRDLYHDYAELRNRIGFVPQEDLLQRELSARRALEFAGRLRFPTDVTGDERVARIDDVLEELGITHVADSPMQQLSGGERKRVSVALELLTKPSLVFLDEPASGLDPGLERSLMRTLRALADGGRTIVVVTHDLSSIRLCDDVLVLAPGGVPAYLGPPGFATQRFGAEDLTDVFSALTADPTRNWRPPRPPADEHAEPQPPVGPITSATPTSRIRLDRPTPLPASPGVPPSNGSVSQGSGSDAPSDGAASGLVELQRRRQSWFVQLRTLVARSAAVLGSDRRNLALLLAQAPLLGLLMLAALPAGELGVPGPQEVRFVSVAPLVLFVLILGVTWLGANVAIREVARELPLLWSERAVGLSLSAYVTAKAIVLGLIVIGQTVVVVALATARQHGPRSAILLGWAPLELTAIVAVAGLASMALALLISALAGSAERATTLLPVVLILQLVLSAGGILPEIVDRPGLEQLSLASSAQWGFAGAAATADVNRLEGFSGRLRDVRTVDATDAIPAVDAITVDYRPEGRWAHTARAWLTALVALALLIIVPLIVTTFALRRFDPGRAG